MHAAWILTLPQEVSISRDTEGELAITGWYERLTLRRLSATMQAAIERLAFPGEQVGRLAELFGENGQSHELARFVYHARQLAGHGLLRYGVQHDGRSLLTLVPTSASFGLIDGSLADDRCTLSRFAYVHRVDEELVVESPLVAARAVLTGLQAASLLFHLATPHTVSELGSLVPQLDATTVDAALQLLIGARMLTRIDREGHAAEDDSASLRMWEFHDLLFHARTRQGRHDAPMGGTYAWLGQVDPPPAVRESFGEPLPLFRPDLARIQENDPPLADVVERRCSLREYAGEPITDRQVGEFLYRVARVKDRFWHAEETTAGTANLEIAPRPYPAAGAMYETELYLVVQHCRGIAAGMYHYEPVEHALSRVAADEAHVAMLVAEAAAAAEIARESVQVLVILAARIPRITWKYSSLAYAAALKHVGVLYQSMYLAATAMDLAPCALGTGDSDVFAMATGNDYYAETSVGEFLLGSRADDARWRGGRDESVS